MWSRDLFDKHRRSSLEHPKKFLCLICRAGFLHLKFPRGVNEVPAGTTLTGCPLPGPGRALISAIRFLFEKVVCGTPYLDSILAGFEVGSFSTARLFSTVDFGPVQRSDLPSATITPDGTGRMGSAL